MHFKHFTKKENTILTNTRATKGEPVSLFYNWIMKLYISKQLQELFVFDKEELINRPSRLKMGCETIKWVDENKNKKIFPL